MDDYCDWDAADAADLMEDEEPHPDDPMARRYTCSRCGDTDVTWDWMEGPTICRHCDAREAEEWDACHEAEIRRRDAENIALGYPF